MAAQVGIAVEKSADFEGAFARLTAPEGTPILLFDRDFLGDAYVVESSRD